MVWSEERQDAFIDAVAKFGYDAMLRGELRAINEGRLRFMLNWIIPWLPRRMALKMIKDMQSK